MAPKVFSWGRKCCKRDAFAPPPLLSRQLALRIPFPGISIYLPVRETYWNGILGTSSPWIGWECVITDTALTTETPDAYSYFYWVDSSNKNSPPFSSETGTLQLQPPLRSGYMMQLTSKGLVVKPLPFMGESGVGIGILADPDHSGRTSPLHPKLAMSAPMQKYIGPVQHPLYDVTCYVDFHYP